MASQPRRKSAAKKATTRAGRAAAKAKATPKRPPVVATKPKVVTPSQPVVISSVWQLSRQTARFLWQQRRLLGGVTALYGLLNVLSLSSQIDISSVRDQFGNRFVGSLAAYTQLVGGTTSFTTGSRFIIFIVACLAVIWSLRQAYAGYNVRIRDAYYKGMYPLVPFVLLFITALLKLLPAAIGISVYQALVVNNILLGGLQRTIGGLLALSLVVVSLYLLTSSVFALFIATLPDMTPRLALRLGRQLVAGRRATIIRKLLFLPLGLALVTSTVMVPLIIYLPAVVPFILLVVGPVVGTTTLTYIYILYRELADV